MFKCAFVAECRAVLRSLAFLWCIHTYAYHYWLHGRARERVRTVCICTMYSPIAGSKMHICENALTAFGLERLRLYSLRFFFSLAVSIFLFFFYIFILTCSVFLVVVFGRKICMRYLWGIIFLSFLLLLVFLTSEFASALIVSLRFRYICFFFNSFFWCNNGCSWWQKMLYLFAMAE